jgi:hypothetical protein
MLNIAMLGNEHNVVAIDTYCDNLPLIATNILVAIDRNPCSEHVIRHLYIFVEKQFF